MDYSALSLILLPAVGFLIGFLVSLVGGSGGLFYVPLLIVGFGVSPRIAVTTSLATMIPTAFIGSWSHRRQGNLDLKAGLTFGLTGIVGALLGVLVSNQISAEDLEKVIGLALIALSVPMAATAIRRMRSKDKPNQAVTTNMQGSRIIVALAFGAMSGFMAGLLGLSGLSFVVTGLYLLGYPATTVVGTSVFVLMFNSAVGLAGYAWFGQFDLALVLLLSVGASAGALLAPKLMSKFQSKTIERVYGPIFVAILLLFGLALLI